MESSRPKGDPEKGLRILVMDDDPAVLRTFIRVLGPAHDVVVTLNPTTGVAAIEAGARFHIIFCDMVMPTLSGIDVYTQVELVDPKQARRIVFLAGDDYAVAGNEVLDRTGNLNLEKPIVPSALLNLVRRILR